jgi:hypothetical protein
VAGSPKSSLATKMVTKMSCAETGPGKLITSSRLSAMQWDLETYGDSLICATRMGAVSRVQRTAGKCRMLCVGHVEDEHLLVAGTNRQYMHGLTSCISTH